MRAPDRRSAELNEILWWSKWASLRWRGDGYLLTSNDLKEHFFNRAGSLTCRGVAGTAAWAERSLARMGMGCTFHVYDSCEAAGSLLDSGYEEVDVMTVLLSKVPMTDRLKGDSKVLASTDAGRWTATYLRAFYGSEDLAGAVRPIVTRASKAGETTLLESRVGGETAGVLAIFRTPGVAGVYCVGTSPEYRTLGVASGLIARARDIAEGEGRSLVLQTLASDGVLDFYLKRGFEAMHAKRVLELNLK